MKLRLPRFFRRPDEESSTLRRVGCVVQIAAAVTLVGLLVTYLHARALVLYGPNDQHYEKLDEMPFMRRVGVFLSGHQRPRPVNVRAPGDLEILFRRVEISGENQGQRLDAWFMPHENPEGLAILVHDYGQSKADLLEVAGKFRDFGYAVLLPDLRASGESEGQETSFGWHEAEDVARVSLRANDYQPAGGRRVIYGLGTGAAAVLRAVAELQVPADALVLEGVFADLLDVFAGHIGATGMVRWPTARICRFWVGYSMGFAAKDHQPWVYATQVTVPTLLLVGQEDTVGVALGAHEAAAKRVSEALKGVSRVKLVPGGRPIAASEPDAWADEILAFLGSLPPYVEAAPPSDVGPVSIAPEALEKVE